jgi:hypothetical protein
MEALDFSATPELEGVNLALPTSPFKYDHWTLGKALKVMPPDGTVLFGICPFSFLLKDFSPAQKGSELFMRYSLLFSRQDFPGDAEEYLPLRDHPFSWKHFFRLFERPSASSANKKRSDRNRDALKRMAQWHQAFFHSPDHKELIDPAALEFNCRILRQMISDASQKQQRILLLMAPLSKELYEEISFPVLEKYLYGPLKNAISGTNVQLLDLMNDPRFGDPEMFIDSFLLAPPGRKQLTQIIAAELNNNQSGMKNA